MKIIEKREMLTLTREEFQILDKARDLLDSISATARIYGEISCSAFSAMDGIDGLLMEDNYIIKEN